MLEGEKTSFNGCHIDGKYTEAEKQRIKDFILGLVYQWCNTHDKNSKLQFIDFIVEKNRNWSYCPLSILIDKNKEQNPNDDDNVIRKKASIDAGWFLKKVLAEDQAHTFERLTNTSSTETYNQDATYKWKPSSD